MISSESTLERPVITPGMIATLYRETAERLDRIGWIQGQGKTRQGECALQALLTVANETMAKLGLSAMRGCGCGECVAAPLAEVATRHLMNFIGWPNIPGWNDHLGRTYAEVRAALIECAERLEKPTVEEPTVEPPPSPDLVILLVALPEWAIVAAEVAADVNWLNQSAAAMSGGVLPRPVSLAELELVAA